MIYLDTNIFLYPLLGNDSKSDLCLAILQKVAAGEIDAGTSALTWDEFYYTLIYKIGKERTHELSKDFLTTPNLIFFDATEEIINRSHELAQQFNLKPRDAIHAATAILNKCDSIVSDDKDFDSVKGLKRVAP